MVFSFQSVLTFTFQHSITQTSSSDILAEVDKDLHSNIVLLKPAVAKCNEIKQANLHSNIVLLKLITD